MIGRHIGTINYFIKIIAHNSGAAAAVLLFGVRSAGSAESCLPIETLFVAVNGSGRVLCVCAYWLNGDNFRVAPVPMIGGNNALCVYPRLDHRHHHHHLPTEARGHIILILILIPFGRINRVVWRKVFQVNRIRSLDRSTDNRPIFRTKTLKQFQFIFQRLSQRKWNVVVAQCVYACVYSNVFLSRMLYLKANGRVGENELANEHTNALTCVRACLFQHPLCASCACVRVFVFVLFYYVFKKGPRVHYLIVFVGARVFNQASRPGNIQRPCWGLVGWFGRGQRRPRRAVWQRCARLDVRARARTQPATSKTGFT